MTGSRRLSLVGWKGKLRLPTEATAVILRAAVRLLLTEGDLHALVGLADFELLPWVHGGGTEERTGALLDERL